MSRNKTKRSGALAFSKKTNNSRDPQVIIRSRQAVAFHTGCISAREGNDKSVDNFFSTPGDDGSEFNSLFFYSLSLFPSHDLSALRFIEDEGRAVCERLWINWSAKMPRFPTLDRCELKQRRVEPKTHIESGRLRGFRRERYFQRAWKFMMKESRSITDPKDSDQFMTSYE